MITAWTEVAWQDYLQRQPVGWVEPFAKPIIFADRQSMGIASLHPSYELGGDVIENRMGGIGIRQIAAKVELLFWPLTLVQ